MTRTTLESALNFLKNTRIFKDADEKVLTNVLNKYGKAVSYAKNDIIFSKENILIRSHLFIFAFISNILGCGS